MRVNGKMKLTMERTMQNKEAATPGAPAASLTFSSRTSLEQSRERDFRVHVSDYVNNNRWV